MKHSKILKKICFLFLVTVLPIILLSSIILLLSNERLKQKTLQNYLQKTIGYTETIDNNISQIYAQATTILTCSEVKKLSVLSPVMNPYDEYLVSKRLKEYIGNVNGALDLLNNIKVYICSRNEAYNANTLISGSREIISDETINILSNLDTSLPGKVIFYDDKLMMFLKSSSDFAPVMVEADFSLSYLKREFASHSSYDNFFYIFNYHDGDYILNNITDERIYYSALSAPYKDGISAFRVDGKQYYGLLCQFKNIDASYLQIISGQKIFQPIQRSLYYVIFFIFVMCLCVTIFFIGAIQIIHKPLTTLIDAFEAASTGDFSIRITEIPNNEFSYLYTGFNDMINHIGTLIDESYNQKILLQKSEFKQLQAQINPHFLYNSFFMLQRMIKKNRQEESVKMSTELGIYFKYITQNYHDFAVLKDEYLHAKIYSNIQAMRFEGRIATEFGDLPNACSSWKVPRLILQPVIENAYNYGLENKEDNGLLVVSFHEHAEGLDIIIEDNGDELTEEKLAKINKSLKMSTQVIDTTEITGLINIFRRIHFFYKNGSTLTATRSDLGGLKVTIFISKKMRGIDYETLTDR